MTMKERFLPEDHAGEHATQTPHVQAVVVHLQIIQRGAMALSGFFTRLCTENRNSLPLHDDGNLRSITW